MTMKNGEIAKTEFSRRIARMGSYRDSDKPHAVCIPCPAQGHITPLLKLARLLHHRDIHITFVNTEYNHRRFLKSKGPNSLDGLPDFRFETIPDGLPPSDADATQHVPSLCESTAKNCLAPFRALLAKLNSSGSVPKVSCIVSDACMSFTLDAAEELGIPDLLFWTTSACGVLAYKHYHLLVEKDLTPLKDESYLTNGYLETTVDFIPAMKNIRLKDLPSFVRTADRNDIMLNFYISESERSSRGTAIIINTFHSFEKEVLEALSKMLPPIYTIGPLHMLEDQLPPNINSKHIESSLWKEQPECLEWLGTKEPNSVVYVNFGSITVVTPHQMMEFAWGLANSNKNFLWIIRPDLVRGESAMLSPEFLSETKDRGMLASWCAQEKVLKHPAVGGFLSHMGWNSTVDSMCAGVPMLCWPFFAEQTINCWFACNKWGVGMEIGNNVKRDEIEKVVRELIDGEKGEKMRRKAMEWKKEADKATSEGGSSSKNFEEIVRIVFASKVKA